MPIVFSFFVRVLNNSSVNYREHEKRQYLVLCGLFIFLILACRHYSVGSGDGVIYYNHWTQMSTVPKERILDVLKTSKMERGYVLFVWVVSRFLKNAQYLFVVYGAIVALSLCSFLKKNCDVLEIGFEIYLCLGLWAFMVQGIRQGIAMCICLWAIDFIKKRKLLPFIVLILIASSFHGSAIAFSIVYFSGYLKFNLKGIAVTVLGIILCCIFIDKIFDLLNFVMNESYYRGEDSLSGGMFTALAYLLIIALSLITLPKEDTEHDTTLFLFMTITGFVTFVMRYYINSISQRVAYYFMFGQMVLLPREIKNMKKSYQIFTIVVVVLLCMGMAIYKSSYSKINPYTFFWEY
jgi:hypothetical protein